jgi:glycosyltransferase involved in cell wall biosynthesis
MENPFGVCEPNASTENRRRPVRVALVGTDLLGEAPGGMATVSRAIVDGFEGRKEIEIIPITNFQEGGALRRAITGVSASWKVLRLRKKLDVVHMQVATGWSIERELLLAYIARSWRIPVIAQFHGAGQAEDYRSGSAIHRYCYRQLLKLCHNVALGDTALGWMVSVDPLVRASILPNGVSVSEDPAPFPDGPPVAVFVGRLGTRKGVFDLLAALEELGKMGLEAQLNVLGDGDVIGASEVVMSSEHLQGCVSLMGWQDEVAVAKAIRSAWVLVLPSYAEGLPMAILEAMAMARPVIASKVGDVASVVIEGSTGLTHSPGDVSALGRAMARILGDREFAKELGLNGYALIQKRYSVSSMLRNLEKLYLEVSCG